MSNSDAGAGADPMGPHVEGGSEARNKLLLATAVATVFMACEIVGGLLSGSLAILTDAAHLLSDISGFLVSLFCLYLSQRKSTPVLSFGFKRAEVLGALLSVAIIWVLTGILVYEAILRTISISKGQRTDFVDGKTMSIVAALGLACNLIIMRVLGHSHSHGGTAGGGGHGHTHGHGHSHGASGQSRQPEENSESTPLRLHEKYDEPHSAEKGHGHDHDHGHGHHDHQSNGLPAGDQVNHDQDDDDADVELGAVEEYTLNALRISAYGSFDGRRHSAAGAESPPGRRVRHRSEHDLGEPPHHHVENINITAAYVHALGDMLQSVGVCIAGALIWAFPGETHPMVQLADPVATFLFSLLVFATTVSVVRASVHVLMEGVPDHIQPQGVHKSLGRIPGVVGVHDLHIWSLTVGEPFLSVHLTVANAPADAVLSRAQHVLRAQGISHSTIQVELCSTQRCDPSCRSETCTMYAQACHEPASADGVRSGGCHQYG